MTDVEEHTLKKTSLYDRHLALNGKMVDFAGWSLPVYYTSILAEHQWTRNSCSFFDVSHLGEIHVKGRDAFSFLQKRFTNDLGKLGDRRMQYHLLCDEMGYTLDDVLIYRENKDEYYVIVNASNIEKDFAEMKKGAGGFSVSIEDQSDAMACLAIQGPKSELILQKSSAFG